MLSLYKIFFERSVRLRITIISALGIAVALGVLSFITYRIVNTNLSKEVDSDLRERNEEVARFFTTHSSGGLSASDLSKFAEVFGGNSTPLESSNNDFIRDKSTLSASLIYLQILDREGKIKQAVPEIKLMQKPENQTAVVNLRSNVTHFDTIQLPSNNEKVRIHTQPLIIGGQTIGYIQSIRSMQEVDTVMDSLALPFILGCMLTILFLAALIWWVTLRTFTPIERITDAAYRISANGNLGERIAIDNRYDDEVTRMGRAFNAMLERLDQSFELQKQFVADSSHELRTPLTVIRGNLDLYRRNPDPESREECLRAIGRETVRMQKLVQDLLFLAKSDSGRVTIEQTNVQLDTIVFDIYKDGAILAEAKGHTLKLSHFVPVQVWGDAEQLKRVVLNLVENAIKYTPDGGQISLGLYKGNKWARIVITDNGLGIANEEQGRVFDRFYRADKARSRSVGGTGLGLAIVKHIVEAHGGRIQLESELGKGSTFTVWLPAMATTEIEDPEFDDIDTPEPVTALKE